MYMYVEMLYMEMGVVEDLERFRNDTTFTFGFVLFR